MFYDCPSFVQSPVKATVSVHVGSIVPSVWFDVGPYFLPAAYRPKSFAAGIRVHIQENAFTVYLHPSTGCKVRQTALLFRTGRGAALAVAQTKPASGQCCPTKTGHCWPLGPSCPDNQPLTRHVLQAYGYRPAGLQHQLRFKNQRLLSIIYKIIQFI